MIRPKTILQVIVITLTLSGTLADESCQGQLSSATHAFGQSSLLDSPSKTSTVPVCRHGNKTGLCTLCRAEMRGVGTATHTVRKMSRWGVVGVVVAAVYILFTTVNIWTLGFWLLVLVILFICVFADETKKKEDKKKT